MKYGKPVKNKKRIDPRYFLNEQEENLEEDLEEDLNEAAPSLAPNMLQMAQDERKSQLSKKIMEKPPEQAASGINVPRAQKDALGSDTSVGGTKFGSGVKQKVGGDVEVTAGASSKGGGVTGTYRWEEGLNRNSGPPRGILKEGKKKTKVSKTGQGRVSKKIAHLIGDEGKDKEQAAAIAYSMEERGELSETSIKDIIAEEIRKFLAKKDL